MSASKAEHMLKADWWLPYVKPSSTWETIIGYNVSLGLLRSKPPSADLEKERIQAYLAGLPEGEGYFYYSPHHIAYLPCVYLRMCEAAPVRFFSQVMNVTVTAVQRSYVSRVKGLRAILLARIIGMMLSGKRRLTSELFVTRGYQVVSRKTLQDYRLIYGSAKQKLLMPTPLRYDDMERYPALQGRDIGSTSWP
jgi:hypothetical protein